jgi:hypothetical protein
VTLSDEEGAYCMEYRGFYSKSNAKKIAFLTNSDPMPESKGDGYFFDPVTATWKKRTRREA